MDRLGPCMLAPVSIQHMNGCECDSKCKSALSGQKTRKALYKYSLFTIWVSFYLLHQQLQSYKFWFIYPEKILQMQQQTASNVTLRGKDKTRDICLML